GPRLSSGEVTLSVKEMKPIFVAAEPARADADISKRIFIRLGIPDRKFYVNERIPITLSLYSDWLDLEDIKVPDMSTTDLVAGEFKKAGTKIENVGPARYAVLEYKSYISGASPGKFVLPAVNISLYIAKVRYAEGAPKPEMLNDNEVFYDRLLGSSERVYRELATEPLGIDVSRLPEDGRPEDFRGIIGSFAMEASSEPYRVKVQDPVNIKAVITGKGNLAAISSLGYKDSEFFKVYDPRVTLEDDKVTIDQVFRPLSSDVKEIPEISISYFDPEKAEYLKLSAGPFQLKVEGVAKSALLPDLSFDKKEKKLEKKLELVGQKRDAGKNGDRHLFYAVSSTGKIDACPHFLLSIVLLLSGLAIKAQMTRLATDFEYARRLRSARIARRAIPALALYIRKGAVKDFYDHAFIFIREYLGARFGLSPHGITENTITSLFDGRPGFETLTTKASSVFSDCYMARFTKESASIEDADKTLTSIKEIVAICSAPNRQNGDSHLFSRRIVIDGCPHFLAVLALSAVFFSAPAACASESASREAIFTRGNAYFASGDYPKAISEYESLVKMKEASGNILYNLANAYMKSGDTGHAILNYERARLLMPRDIDLIMNLRTARQLMKQKDPRSNKSWFESSLDGLYHYLTLSETFFLALFLYYVLISLTLVYIFVRKIRSYTKTAIIIISLLIFSAILPIRNKVVELEKGGVVSGAITDARYEPSMSSKVHYPLYDGMKVLVLKTNEGWYKVKRNDGKIGWVEKKFVILFNTSH
ncbi:MAG: tetratricopeptide repeat protein, partial [Candidatus Omnitrophota bacterium]